MLPLNLGKKVSEPLELLCLGAHSDDIEIGCGGAVLSLLSRFSETTVRWIVFSGNEAREKEARAGATRILRNAKDAVVETYQFQDAYFPSLKASLKDVFEALKPEVNPDLIFTHWRDDAHQDHRTINELTRNTWRRHLILEYEIPKVDGDLGRPNLFVPLSPSIAKRKVDILMRTFGSQRDRSWFDEDVFRGLLRLRGMEAAAPSGYAEAFHAYKLSLAG